MKRGDLVTVALQGDFGKPRPAVIIQTDMSETETVVVLLISSTLTEAPHLRTDVPPSSTNGLRRPSQIMIEKVYAVHRSKIGQIFGTLEEDILLAATHSLAVLIGLAD